MKILIVDDEPLVRKSLGRAFKAKGHDVTEAVDGSEGLAKWASVAPDVAMVDILMPGLSGPELLNAVRAQLPSWKGRIVLMSAYSGEHNITTAQQLGADLFVPKPFDDVFALVRTAEDLFDQQATPQTDPKFSDAEGAHKFSDAEGAHKFSDAEGVDESLSDRGQDGDRRAGSRRSDR